MRRRIPAERVPCTGGRMRLAIRLTKFRASGCATMLLIMTALWLASCSGRPPRTVERSFYDWQADFRLNRRDVATLRQLTVTRLYLKFFDVVWGGASGPAPASPLRFTDPPPPFAAVIPCVFITNETMINVPSDRVGDLAVQISSKIERMMRRNHLRRVPEAQLDCDWTLQTRAKYFRLLQAIRPRLAARGIRLSATIRLHQIKYRKLTGIPPVDRGMLMFYNMTPVKEFGTANSILNPAAGKTYTTDLQTYPLPLDIALPLFSWGVIFQDDHFIGLANDFGREELRGNPNFESYASPNSEPDASPDANYFRVKHDVYLHHTQLYRGDLIRVEESDYRALRECAAYLARRLPAAPTSRQSLNVAFFHFDALNRRRIGDGKIADLFDCFR